MIYTLGEGGQAIVYNVVNKRMGKVFALKKYLKRQLRLKMVHFAAK